MWPCTPNKREQLPFEHLNFQLHVHSRKNTTLSKNCSPIDCASLVCPTSYAKGIFHLFYHLLSYRKSASRELRVKQSEIVPSSIIPLNPNKNRSLRRCWINIFRYLIERSIIIQLFTLFSCVTSLHSSYEPLPCKNFALFTQFNGSNINQCTVWSDDIIPEICSAGTQSRLRILKHVFLMPELQPLSLFEVFSVGTDQTENWLLKTGYMGNDCILGSINRCTVCFQRISGTLRKLNEAFQSFDTTLSRFDCLPAIDTATATRPFSPNATCVNCKIWYRRWLLVQSLQIWQRAPCINWCYYTQLACPHLAPAKLWDYAGHPSFQCRGVLFILR